MDYLQRGADPNIILEDLTSYVKRWTTPVADCVAHAFTEADVEAIIILVECGGNLVHTFTEDGHLNKVNALVRAAEFDKVEALKTMLSINKSLIKQLH